MSDISEIKQIALKAGIGVATGTNTYAVTISEVKSLFIGLCISVQIPTTCTGACTLNLNQFGAINIYKGVTTALGANDMLAGSMQYFSYDGANWQITPTVILPTGASMVLSNNSSGVVQAIYSIVDILGATTEATLLAQDWTSGSVTATGSAGQKVYGTNYIFECTGTNNWKRMPTNVNTVDYYFAIITDNTVQTSTQMAAAYPNAVQGSRVRGNVGFYEYFGGVGWWYFAKTS